MEVLQIPDIDRPEQEQEAAVRMAERGYDVNAFIRRVLDQVPEAWDDQVQDTSGETPAEKGINADTHQFGLDHAADEAKRNRNPGQSAGTDYDRDCVPADTLDLFLLKASNVPLLTPAEEIALAKRIQRGDKAARNHMVEANILLVMFVAKDYRHNQHSGHGLQLVDLVQEGCIGLIRAAETFDPAKAKFSTYAANGIRMAINRAISNKSLDIRVPVEVLGDAYKADQAETALRNELGREPSVDEVAKRIERKVQHVETARTTPRVVTSLNRELKIRQDAEARTELGEMLPSSQDVVSEAAANIALANGHNDAPEENQGALSELDALERNVLLRIFVDEANLGEVAEDMGITIGKVRAIKKASAMKFREIVEARSAAQTD